MNTVPFKCRIETNNADSPVGLKILLDNNIIFSCDQLTEPVNFVHDILEDENNHEISFEMFAKTADHTVIDDQGNILKDTFIKINDISLDDINIDQVVFDKSVYGHNFNGTQPPIEDKFFGVMGCNGTVRLQFSTPIYIWLLENL